MLPGADRARWAYDALRRRMSMPRSRSQARTAAAGRGQPFTFSYAATVTQPSVPVSAGELGRFMGP